MSMMGKIVRNHLVPEVSIIVPTYNERANIEALVKSVDAVMGHVAWEIIVVDDDSPDRTWAEVARIAAVEPRLRCVRRVGRRGLASAVIEGAMAASGDLIAVMDADFQHDETILPKMFDMLIADDADLVVGTRYAAGGSVGDWNATRQQMSGFATRAARALIGNRTSDPMSGFFMARRQVFSGSIYNLSSQGYKILLDLISSYPGTLCIAEVPYTFRNRREGESKLSPMVLAEFAFLLIEKLSRGWIPPRFVLFALVGGLGLGVHLIVLSLLIGAGVPFISAQGAAVAAAIIFNYVLNNEFTYRDRRLSGLNFVGGMVMFAVICSIGAVANIGVANLAIEETNSWSLAGIAGAIMGAVFNFGGASSIVWGRNRKRAVVAS
ncbi:MAG: glycosyltransferase family 2 protein [Sphingomonas sp.]|nr:glycosyltransferase family 2 protein [Sphingomonas sp.]